MVLDMIYLKKKKALGDKLRKIPKINNNVIEFGFSGKLKLKSKGRKV